MLQCSTIIVRHTNLNMGMLSKLHPARGSNVSTLTPFRHFLYVPTMDSLSVQSVRRCTPNLDCTYELKILSI